MTVIIILLGLISSCWACFSSNQANTVNTTAAFTQSRTTTSTTPPACSSGYVYDGQTCIGIYLSCLSAIEKYLLFII